MPRDVSSTTSAIQTINSTLAALEQTRNAVKNLSAIEQQISGIHDFILELKEKIVELQQENMELKRNKLALEEELHTAQPKHKRKAEINRTPQGYFRLGSDSTAYCATCYEKKNDALISLTPPEPYGGGVRRVCPLCKREYWDEPRKPNRLNP